MTPHKVCLAPMLARSLKVYSNPVEIRTAVCGEAAVCSSSSSFIILHVCVRFKTESVGSSEASPTSALSLKWVQGMLKYLGRYVVKETTETNWGMTYSFMTKHTSSEAGDFMFRTRHVK